MCADICALCSLNTLNLSHLPDNTTTLEYHTQQKSYSISHLLGTVTTLRLDSDCVVSVDNCRQIGDRAANGSVVTMLPAVVNSHYTVTVQSQCSDCT